MNAFRRLSRSLWKKFTTQKSLDAPSGTAITLAEGIIEDSSNTTDWELRKLVIQFNQDKYSNSSKTNSG